MLSKYPITEKHPALYRNSYSGTADYLSTRGLARTCRPAKGPETLPKAHQTRMAQLGELRDLAAAHVPAGDAVAVAGDLNIEYWAGQDRRDAAGRTQAEQGAAALGGTLRTTGAGEYTFDAATNPDAAKSVPATYRDSLDYVGSLRRAEVGPVQLVHYDGGTIPSDHYPVRAEIHY